MKHPDGHTTPIWRVDPPNPSAQRRPLATGVDVCVVGAGIAGMTTTYLLAKAGKRVTVLDEGPIGGGQTHRSSAHLSSVIDDRMVKMEEVHGPRGAELAVQSHAAAIDRIEAIALTEGIDCDFARVPAFLLASSDAETGDLERELLASRRAGLRAELIQRGPLPGLAGPAIRYEAQARFDPSKYMAGLAEACARAGVTVRSGCRVTEVSGPPNRSAESPRATLASGEVVEAGSIVVATNTPGPIVAWAGVHFKQSAYRTYLIGIRCTGVADALYWDTLDPYHYARLVEDVLIIGGEDHRTGQRPDDHAAFTALERWARGAFGELGEVVSRWSGQVQEPTDGLAFIGRVEAAGHGILAITGDSGMGLTHATLGAALVTDLIVGHPNPWSELYDPQRKPTHTLGEFAMENMNTAAQWLELVTPGETSDVATIGPGSGAIVRSGLTKLAVYRDDEGVLHSCSAVCPHLGAIVQWNPVERTWDCPAHGSRFAAQGALLIGPSNAELPTL